MSRLFFPRLKSWAHPWKTRYRYAEKKTTKRYLVYQGCGSLSIERQWTLNGRIHRKSPSQMNSSIKPPLNSNQRCGHGCGIKSAAQVMGRRLKKRDYRPITCRVRSIPHSCPTTHSSILCSMSGLTILIVNQPLSTHSIRSRYDHLPVTRVS